MRRWSILIGGSALAALGFTWGGDDAGAAIGADALLHAVHAALPPGSELTYGSAESSSFGDVTRFKDFTLRLGPAEGYASILKAGELELKGALTGLVGDGLTVAGRSVTREVPAGERLSLDSFQADAIPYTVFISLLTGQDPGSGRFTGPVRGEGLQLTNDGSHLQLGRYAWSRLASDRISEVQVANVDAGTKGDHIRAESLLLSDLDWTKVDLPGLLRAVDAMSVAAARAKEAERISPQGAQPLRAEPAAYFFATLEALVAAAEGKLEGLEVTGLQLSPGTPGTPRLNLVSLRLDEVSRHRIGPLRIDGFSGSDARFAMRLNGLSYHAVLDALPLAELRQLLAAVPRTDAGAAQLADLLARTEGRSTFAVQSLWMAPPSLRDGVTLNDLAIASSASAERDETAVTLGRFALDLAALLASQDESQLVGKLRSAGLDRAVGGLRARWGIDKRSRRAAIDDFLLELDELASLEVTGEIAGDASFVLKPEQAWDTTQLVRARLVYEDRSLLHRILTAATGDGGMPPDMLAETFADFVADPARMPWLAPPSGEAVASFLRTPGRLEITLTPPRPVSPDTLRRLVFSTPAQLAATLGLEVQATPP